MTDETIVETTESEQVVPEQAPSDVSTSSWRCPRDGTVMEARGGRGGAWRCPQCRGIFLDVETWRQGAGNRPPAWAPVVMSVLVSLLATFIVRRLRHRQTA